MADRMMMSFSKYGAVADAFPNRVEAIATLKAKLDEYARTGNTEFLMDVANYAMIEFMHPAHKDAFFEPTDKSSGRKWIDEVDSSERANTPDKWV
jgi:hypothetical protein